MLIVNNNVVVSNNPMVSHSDVAIVNCPQLPSNCHYVQNVLSYSAPNVKWGTIYLHGCVFQWCSAETVCPRDIKH